LSGDAIGEAAQAAPVRIGTAYTVVADPHHQVAVGVDGLHLHQPGVGVTCGIRERFGDDK
jgi:hypothetical protein